MEDMEDIILKLLFKQEGPTLVAQYPYLDPTLVPEHAKQLARLISDSYEQQR